MLLRLRHACALRPLGSLGHVGAEVDRRPKGARGAMERGLAGKGDWASADRVTVAGRRPWLS